MFDSPAYCVRQYLIENGYVSYPSALVDWPMFVQHINDVDREDVCAIYDTDPVKDGRIFATGEVIEHQGLQVKTRSKEYETGFLKDDEIQRFLCAIQNADVTYNGTTWRLNNLTKLSAAFVGVDERRRNIFSSNYILTATKVS